MVWGDHIACHDWAATRMARAGFSPEGFDWPGHGKSGGRRGDLKTVEFACDLIDEIIEGMTALSSRSFRSLDRGFPVAPLPRQKETGRTGKPLSMDLAEFSAIASKPQSKCTQAKSCQADWPGSSKIHVSNRGDPCTVLPLDRWNKKEQRSPEFQRLSYPCFFAFWKQLVGL